MAVGEPSLPAWEREVGGWTWRGLGYIAELGLRSTCTCAERRESATLGLVLALRTSECARLGVRYGRDRDLETRE
jgi:hypothetical protein